MYGKRYRNRKQVPFPFNPVKCYNLSFDFKIIKPGSPPCGHTKETASECRETVAIYAFIGLSYFMS